MEEKTVDETQQSPHCPSPLPPHADISLILSFLPFAEKDTQHQSASCTAIFTAPRLDPGFGMV